MGCKQVDRSSDEHKTGRLLRVWVMLVGVVCSITAVADDRPYLCELGLQAGCGYYVGDATTHIFNNPREAYGAHFRYKFTNRWALQVKGLTQRITGYAYDDRMQKQDAMWSTQMVNLDAMAEFNFFRFGGKTYDIRIKPLTPYIFLGVGVAMYGNGMNVSGWNWSDYGGKVPVAFYIPMGFGLKWKFAKRFGLNLAWQHNLYVADNLEGMANLNNTYDLNGSNILNFDVTSQLTLGIVFEFAQEKKECRTCMY